MNYTMSTYPYLSEGTFMSICNHELSFRNKKYINPSDIKRPYEIIFIRNSNPTLAYFFEKIHPYIRYKYVLITAGSIETFPGIFSKYLEEDKLHAWFCKNNSLYNHPKMYSLPLGCKNRDVSNKFDIMKKYYMKDPEIIKENMFDKDKKNLYFVNFKKGPYRSQTRYVAEKVLKKYGYENIDFMKQEDFFKKVSEHKFVISPLGSGYDCYRHWESMYLGSIPITTKSCIDKIYDDLPIIILNNWEEFSPELIDKKYKELYDKKDEFNWDKLYAPYWYDKIFRKISEGEDYSKNFDT